MLWHVLLIAAGTISLFLYEMNNFEDTKAARTIAVNVMVFFQIYYLWAMFPLQNKLSAMMPVILATSGVLFFQLGFTYIPWMQIIFATAPLDDIAWVKVIAVSAVIFLSVWGQRRFAINVAS